MVDTGSQSSFATENLIKRLGLSTDRLKSINVTGINNTVGFKIGQSCNIQIKSRVMPFEFNVKCLVVPRITGILPNSVIDIESLKLPSNIELADPKYYLPAEVDILLGADIYWDLIGGSIIKLGLNKPVLQESKLGWLVGGPLSISQSIRGVQCNFSQEIKDSLERFWNIDDLPLHTKTYSAEEKLCEQHFVDNVSRLPTGRFSVKIPFKGAPEIQLGDSYYVAKNVYKA